jgi:hypothetical protein
MTRRVLTRAALVFAILGLAFVSVPLFGSLAPGVRADAALPRIDVSQLEPGRPELRDHPTQGSLYAGFRWSVLLLRHADGSLSAWDVPTREGKVAMPDIHWWSPFYTCQAFGLTFASPDEAGIFSCHDPQLPSDYWRGEWRWSESGKALGKSVDDMQATVGSVEGDYFVVGDGTHEAQYRR